jgi:ABC-type glycerol-3-phosphate transport system permease component
MSATTGMRQVTAANETTTTQARRPRFGRVVLHVVAIGIVLLFVGPLFWLVSSSLKDPTEIVTYPPQAFPAVPQWENYLKPFRRVPFARFIVNSTIVSGLSVVGTLISCAATAYGFAKFRFPGRNLLFGLVLATLLLPKEVTIIPLFLLFRQIGWIDTLLPLIVPSFFAASGGAFFIFLLRQFFLTIPNDFSEAATLDGASSVQIFRLIILPLSMPALSTVAIFSFLSHWNDFLEPLIFLNSPENLTLALGLRFLQTAPAEGEPLEHVLMAGAVIYMLPVMILFIFCQRYFTRGLVMSGIKG